MTNSREVADEMPQDVMSLPKSSWKCIYFVVFTNQICENEAGMLVHL